MMGKWAFILTVAAAVAGGATSASAISYDFNSCHIATGCGDTPFGTVTLTQLDSDTVQITVSGPNFTFFAATGAIKPTGSNVLFAFNGADSATDITVTSPLSPVLTGASGTFEVNGQPDFGTFDSAVVCATCNGATTISSITFTVDNATIAELTQPNTANVLFIADVLINGATGVIDVSVPGPIVGAGLPGLVLACGGLLGLARRRRQKIA
jgi:hypothetical protein